jgi:hypothetical protein
MLTPPQNRPRRKTQICLPRPSLLGIGILFETRDRDRSWQKITACRASTQCAAVALPPTLNFLVSSTIGAAISVITPMM